MDIVKIALYGSNGHQVQRLLPNLPQARLVAIAQFDPNDLPDRPEDLACYDSLDEILADDRVDFVSLCSPRRADQAADAIRCLEAGKHTYAEKPCAMTEAELDAIIAAAERSSATFHEMAGSAFEQPYVTMRQRVADGQVGDVVQVFAQKSYPYHSRRPQDEGVDGGLTLQVGVHAMRFVEHITGIQATAVRAVETRIGNPGTGDLRMAVSMMLTLANGGVGTVICNYLNSPQFGHWGNEHVRIWGTEGFIEATDAGTRTRLCRNDRDCGELKLDAPAGEYLAMFLDSLCGGPPMPLSLAQELHPLRMVIRARDNARGCPA